MDRHSSSPRPQKERAFRVILWQWGIVYQLKKRFTVLYSITYPVQEEGLSEVVGCRFGCRIVRHSAGSIPTQIPHTNADQNGIPHFLQIRKYPVPFLPCLVWRCETAGVASGLHAAARPMQACRCRFVLESSVDCGGGGPVIRPVGPVGRVDQQVEASLPDS